MPTDIMPDQSPGAASTDLFGALHLFIDDATQVEVETGKRAACIVVGPPTGGSVAIHHIHGIPGNPVDSLDMLERFARRILDATAEARTRWYDEQDRPVEQATVDHPAHDVTDAEVIHHLVTYRGEDLHEVESVAENGDIADLLDAHEHHHLQAAGVTV